MELLLRHEHGRALAVGSAEGSSRSGPSVNALTRTDAFRDLMHLYISAYWRLESNISDADAAVELH